MDELWKLIGQIGVVLLVPIAGALGAILVQKIKLQALNIKGDVWEKTKLITKISVQSAEQQGKVKEIPDKKIYALGVAKKLLKAENIKLDDTLLSEIIESEVWETLNSPKANPVPSVVLNGNVNGNIPEKEIVEEKKIPEEVPEQG